MRADALGDANFALGLTNDDAFVLSRSAKVLAYIGHEFDRASSLVERAITLNPNLAVGWLDRGWISLLLGEGERAIESFETMLRLSPIDPLRPLLFSGIAFGHFFLNHYDEGCRIAKEIMQLFPHHQSFVSYLINCVGAAELQEANKAAIQLLKYDPTFTVSRASAIFPIRSPAIRQKFDNALRAAYVPE
jgi:adenylate cyclase